MRSYSNIGRLVTIYLKRTGEYSNCRGLWELQDDGQYKCQKTGELQYCYEIEYRGSGWNRCYIGVPIEVPKEQYSGTQTGEVCNSQRCWT